LHSGGLARDLDGFFYRDILRAIKQAIPAMHVHAFSPMEISYGVDKTGMPLRDYLQMMKTKAWAAFPEPPPKFWTTAYAENSALINCR